MQKLKGVFFFSLSGTEIPPFLIEFALIRLKGISLVHFGSLMFYLYLNVPRISFLEKLSATFYFQCSERRDMSECFTVF